MFKPLQFASCPRCFGSKLFKLAEGVYRCATVGCRQEVEYQGREHNAILLDGWVLDARWLGRELLYA